MLFGNHSWVNLNFIVKKWNTNIFSSKYVLIVSETMNFIHKFSKILQRLCKQEESIPFKTSACDSSESTTSEEIDLIVVRTRLSSGYYNSDPWLFVNDVWLIFDYARMYNSPSSKVYKCCDIVSWIILIFHFTNESFLLITILPLVDRNFWSKN